MDDLLLLTGAEAWCAECDEVTIFVAVDPGLDECCCTVCDAAFVGAVARPAA